VAFALLNPDDAANVASATAHSAAYAALPAGTVWRLGENAGLNSAALYEALSPKIHNDALSKTGQVDFKATREIGQLPGGPMGIALGTEFRRESIYLTPNTGTERGNIIGLGYSAYSGTRDVVAAYGELLAPVTKTLELSAALRGDHYSDVGNSVTPKLGAKWLPVKSFALRGTYSQGFRAPSSAENGDGGLAAFGAAGDPLRCALGVPGTCGQLPVAIITSPNPDLKPEKSKSFTLGFVWDPASKTSIAVDLWQIQRSNEINQELPEAAIAAGKVVRDPSTAGNIPGDPGGIVAVLARYVNSARTTVRGLDVEAHQGFDLGADRGKLTLDLGWTHLFKWLRQEQDGTRFEFAGTHGNCSVTNCIGTPDDRINVGASWTLGAWDVAGVANYRGPLVNKAFKDDPAGCAASFADGTDAPAGCRIASFTTVDLTARWKATPQLEFFGTVQNLFDKLPPLDPTTYGAAAYNPLDYSGAVGRFYNVGVKIRF
jgi:iron complex outermembrane receptor protein